MSRQVTLFQTFFKLIGVLLLVPLFYLEVYWRIPGIRRLSEIITADQGHQASCVYLISQLVSALAVSLIYKPTTRMLAKFSPATEQEELAKPHFIYDQAIEEPKTALQLRVVKRFPNYLDSVREDTRHDPYQSAETFHQASRSILKEIDSFMTDLMDQNVSRLSLERSIAIQTLTTSISQLEESLYDWVKALSTSNLGSQLPMLTHGFAEGLHVTLLTLVDTLESPDSYNIQLLTTITSDRGEMMEEIRKSIFREESAGTHQNQQALYSITTIFERLIWLMRRISTLLTTIHVI